MTDIFFVFLFVRALRVVLHVLAHSDHLLLQLLHELCLLLFAAHLDEVLELVYRCELRIYSKCAS